MVVADYSVQISEERQLQDAAIDNFCPRLCEPVRRLSQHKVGELTVSVASNARPMAHVYGNTRSSGHIR